jgi:small conductance mechanosensitive channel
MFDNTVISQLLKIVYGIGLIILVFILASLAKGLLQRKYANMLRKTDRRENEQTSLAYIFVTNVVYFCIVLIGMLMILQTFGVQTTGLIALVTTFGFGIGISLQGVLTDLAAGVIIAFSSIYRIGDDIEVDGVRGNVKSYTLLNTVVKEKETNMHIVIPNRKIQDSVLTNHSREQVRWLPITIALSHSNKSFDRIIDSIRYEIGNSSKYPGIAGKFSIGVKDMSGNSTVIAIRVPLKQGCSEECVLDLQTKLRVFLENAGIKLQSQGMDK